MVGFFCDLRVGWVCFLECLIWGLGVVMISVHFGLNCRFVSFGIGGSHMVV